ncbi:hypothetical protein NDU88_001546 [Pleurodeles waltl]|uniref:Uncharacterized protein n=1 Tax=Pleurodeles waltl TaxID=8319 RepID=A0AAV7KTP1_PLEWA|nr:hypothetical protein NDU88_001546 [Pleurodeles waltl]
MERQTAEVTALFNKETLPEESPRTLEVTKLDKILEQSAAQGKTCAADYTFAVQHRRASFRGVKRRQASLSYYFLFPAKLKIVVNDSSCFYTESKDASAWVEQL